MPAARSSSGLPRPCLCGSRGPTSWGNTTWRAAPRPCSTSWTPRSASGCPPPSTYTPTWKPTRTARSWWKPATETKPAQEVRRSWGTASTSTPGGIIATVTRAARVEEGGTTPITGESTTRTARATGTTRLDPPRGTAAMWEEGRRTGATATITPIERQETETDAWSTELKRRAEGEERTTQRGRADTVVWPKLSPLWPETIAGGTRTDPEAAGTTPQIVLWSHLQQSWNDTLLFPQGEAGRDRGGQPRRQSITAEEEQSDPQRKAGRRRQPEELHQGQPGRTQQQRHPHPRHHHRPAWRHHLHTQSVQNTVKNNGKQLVFLKRRFSG